MVGLDAGGGVGRAGGVAGGMVPLAAFEGVGVAIGTVVAGDVPWPPTRGSEGDGDAAASSMVLMLDLDALTVTSTAATAASAIGAHGLHDAAAATPASVPGGLDLAA